MNVTMGERRGEDDVGNGQVNSSALRLPGSAMGEAPACLICSETEERYLEMEGMSETHSHGRASSTQWGRAVLFRVRITHWQTPHFVVGDKRMPANLFTTLPNSQSRAFIT